MKKMKNILIATIAMFCLIANSAEKENSDLPIKIVVDKNLFANIEYTISVITKENVNKNLNWNINTLGRTYRAGSAKIPETGIVTIKFKTPNIKAGVIGSFKITCSINELEINKEFYIFHKNPFELDKALIKDLGVSLYDLNENKYLTKFIEKNEVPIKLTQVIDDFDGNILIVTNMNFDDFSGIEESIFAEVAKGKKIIFISPLGSFPLNNKKIKSIKLSGNEIIKEYNKKYDDILKFNIIFSQIDDITHLNFNSKNSNFAFCKMNIEKGEIIFVGLDIYENNKISPTAIYLLKDIIIKTNNNK